MLTGFMAEVLCPAVSMNASVCAGGAEIIGGSLLNALSGALLDPVYFCTVTLPMCD
jgi:sphingomyelin phosphodiesterase